MRGEKKKACWCKILKHIFLAAFLSVYFAYILMNLLFIFDSFLFAFLLIRKIHIRKYFKDLLFLQTPNSCLSCVTKYWFLINVSFSYHRIWKFFSYICLANLKSYYLYLWVQYPDRSISLCRNRCREHENSRQQILVASGFYNKARD